MDVADRELDRMIERRSCNGEVDPDEREEIWKESVRRYNARRRDLEGTLRYPASLGGAAVVDAPRDGADAA